MLLNQLTGSAYLCKSTNITLSLCFGVFYTKYKAKKVVARETSIALKNTWEYVNFAGVSMNHEKWNIDIMNLERSKN